MKRLFGAMAAILLFSLPATVHAAAYSRNFHGAIDAARLSGVEPDGDPLYQVAMTMHMPAQGQIPATSIVVSAYLENFSPDTTPTLPDLLHPNQTAQNLGGFLDGKAILVDDAGNTLGTGVFVNEAFLNNTNHAVLRFYSAKNQATGKLAGVFTLARKGGMSGQLSGQIILPPAALALARRDQGKTMKPLKQIIDQVTVHPHYYGTKGVHASHPYNTGFGNSASGGGTGHGQTLSPLTMAAGAGAIVCLLIAGGLYLIERRGKRGAPSLQ